MRHGGLGVINPTKNNSHQYQSSKRITAPLVSLILEQSLHTISRLKNNKSGPRKKLRDNVHCKTQWQPKSLKQSIRRHEKSDTSLISEGSLELALYPPYSRARIYPPQGRFSRLPLPPLWMATCSPTISMYLQPQVHS